MNDTEKRTGFPSVFKAAYEYNWELKNLGYDYTNTLLQKTLSSYMFRNTRLATFINSYVNSIMVFYVDSVKYLRIFYNYAVPKDYKKIN